jgi:hypothetical protein
MSLLVSADLDSAPGAAAVLAEGPPAAQTIGCGR